MLPTLIAILMLPLAALAARYLPTTPEAPWPSRIQGLIAAFSLATVIAALQAFVFEADSCIDAGGVMHSSGQCELGPRSDPYVPQLARPAFTYPGVSILWLALLVNAFVPSSVVYQLTVRAVNRAREGKPERASRRAA